MILTRNNPVTVAFMVLGKRNRYELLFLLVVVMLVVGRSNATERRHGIPFRHLDNPEITAFAKKLFDQTYHQEIIEVSASSDDEEKRRRLQWLLHDGFPFGTLYADIDINDDGIPERFVQFSDTYACGTAGCKTFVYRRVHGSFELMCTPDLGGDLFKQGEVVETGIILRRTEYGYHLIDTGDGIIHWYIRQRPPYQCDAISYKG